MEGKKGTKEEPIIIKDLKEINNYIKDLKENEMLSIDFGVEGDSDENDVFEYNGEVVNIPDDPTEGDEGYDDKFNYDN